MSGLQNHKYLVNILHTFQDSKSLYFVMQYMPNGSLNELLEQYGQLNKEVVQYYSAQILLCIEFLHKN